MKRTHFTFKLHSIWKQYKVAPIHKTKSRKRYKLIINQMFHVGDCFCARRVARFWFYVESIGLFRVFLRTPASIYLSLVTFE